MKRLLVLAALALALAACAPAAVPTFDRAGETVQIDVVANQALYGATLSVVNAETTDERCVQLGETDLGCNLGDLPEGTSTTVTVTSEGSLSCVLFGFTEPGVTTSYKPYPCTTK